MTRAEELKSLMTLPTVQPGVARATSDGHMPQNRATLGGGGSGGSRPLGAPGAAAAAAPPEREVLEFEDEILREVMDSTTGVSWDSIAGLEFAKEQLVRDI